MLCAIATFLYCTNKGMSKVFLLQGFIMWNLSLPCMAGDKSPPCLYFWGKVRILPFWKKDLWIHFQEITSILEGETWFIHFVKTQKTFHCVGENWENLYYCCVVFVIVVMILERCLFGGCSPVITQILSDFIWTLCFTGGHAQVYLALLTNVTSPIIGYSGVLFPSLPSCTALLSSFVF